MLITASLDERLQSQDRANRLFDGTVDRLDRPAIEGERTNVPMAANDIGFAAEHDRALARGIWAIAGEIGCLQEAIAAGGPQSKKYSISVQREAPDSLRQSQKRKVQAIAEVQKVVGRFGAQLAGAVEENYHQVLAIAEMLRAKEQQGEEVAGLKQRAELLEQDNPVPSWAKELRPPGQEVPRLSHSFGELVAVVGLGWIKGHGRAFGAGASECCGSTYVP
jgi:hypothetical protein